MREASSMLRTTNGGWSRPRTQEVEVSDDVVFCASSAAIPLLRSTFGVGFDLLISAIVMSYGSSILLEDYVAVSIYRLLSSVA